MSQVNYVRVIDKPEEPGDFYAYYEGNLKEYKKVLKEIRSRKFFDKYVYPVIQLMIKTLENKGTIYFSGNGGSMSDSSHIASELSGKFNMVRKPLKAENLMSDLNFVTAVSNDLEYDKIFSRAIEFKCNKNDLIIFLSTSGGSKNILEGIKKAKEKEIETVLISGNALYGSTFTINKEDSSLKDLKISNVNKCNINLLIPSSNTARIQEIYMSILHNICNVIERYFFKSNRVYQQNTYRLNNPTNTNAGFDPGKKIITQTNCNKNSVDEHGNYLLDFGK